jgi:ATP-dependent RNA helicase DHX57
LPLHASLPSTEQRRVFLRPPTGKRKVIVSTNVAETSITIDDVTAVIDSGKVKQLTYDSVTNIVTLAEQWTSRASAKQRRGRAGRVSEGTCYKLFSKRTEGKMEERTSPEIQRIPLEQLCLSALGMGWKDVIGFLGRTVSPPKVEALERAMTTLKDVGALDGGELSFLGRHMAAIPADLRCSKLMVLGSVFGCLSAVVTIASIIAVKSPFVWPPDKREAAAEARKRFSNGSGDLMTDAKAFDTWSEMRRKNGLVSTRRWCEEVHTSLTSRSLLQNFVSFQTLSDISSTRTSYLSSLEEVGLIRSTSAADVEAVSKYSCNAGLVRSLIGAALFPNIARIVLPATKYEKISSGTLALDPEAKTIKFYTSTSDSDRKDERVFIHPGSTLFTNTSFIDDSPFAAFFTRVQTSKVFLRDVTPVNALALLLLCGDKIEIDHLGRGMQVQGLRVKAWARIGTLIAVLRRLLDERLKWKIEYPAMDILEDDVVQCLRTIVSSIDVH